MNKTLTTKKLDKTAKELQEFILQAKRKLLEVDVMAGEIEIEAKKGKLKSYKTAGDLIKNL